MGVVISQQLAAFLASGLLGALLGLVYDLLRSLRGLCRGRGLWAADLLYCAAVVVSVFYLTMTFGRGELRLYMVLGILGGAVLFFCLLSPLLRPLWDFWGECLRTTLGILAWPLVLLLRLAKKFARIVKKLFSFFAKWFTIIGHQWRIVWFRRGRSGHEKAGKGRQARRR